uniref:Protein Dr1 n=1 Tax=Acyrthosiphon pisum TaxID=7029 RepID=C4WWQ8_ACYPI|nr:ACYPI002304 [Acyrthosiphon pisum]
MSMIKPSNTMSDNDRLVPCCSTSNPMPSSSITDSNPSCSKTTQISNPNTSSLNEGCSNPGPSNEDEELALPRASINKMIKDALPNIRVANDVREMIMNCCTEFIHLVASEANQVCMAQQKKTINAEQFINCPRPFGIWRLSSTSREKLVKTVSLKEEDKVQDSKI